MAQHSLRRRTFTAQLLTFVAGSSLGSNLFAKVSTKSAELVLLAKNAPAGIDPAGYLISEKLDGVRAPVSYTHLDVYKRQVHPSSP